MSKTSNTNTNIPTLTPEEIDAIHAELYLVNSSNHCANPGCLSWIRGYGNMQVRLMEKRRKKQKKNE